MRRTTVEVLKSLIHQDWPKTPSAKLKLPFGVDAHDDTRSATAPPPRGIRLVTAVATDFVVAAAAAAA